MANIIFNTGKEFLAKYVFEESVAKPTSVDVGLYHDATDSLTETDDVSAITTEPSGSNYERQTVSFGSTDWDTTLNNNDWDAIFSEIVFDLSDSNNLIDNYFVVLSFQAEGESSANDHLFFVSSLDQEYDISNLDEFRGSQGGVTVSGV